VIKNVFEELKRRFGKGKSPATRAEREAPSAGPEALSPPYTLEAGILKEWEDPAGTIRIPEGCVKIGDSVFSGERYIYDLECPEGLLAIGDLAFYGCKRLEKAKLPKSLRSIGDRAFSGCEVLRELQLPPGLESLGEGAFSGCKLLQRLEIPRGIRALPKEVFSNCHCLVELKLPKALESFGENCFSNCRSLLMVEDENYLAHPEIYDTSPYGALARRFIALYPGQPVPAVFPRSVLGDLQGSYSGRFLRASGFSFFQRDRSYHFSLPDEKGVVEVSSYAGEEDADEDGFGGEVCYDYYLLDRETYSPIPGVKSFYSYSNLDMRNAGEEWQKNREKAGAVLQKKKQEK